MTAFLCLLLDLTPTTVAPRLALVRSSPKPFARCAGEEIYTSMGVGPRTYFTTVANRTSSQT